MLGSFEGGEEGLTRRLTTILPAMTLAEALETIQIPRVAGLTSGCTAVVTTRPFRAPHHTISDVGLIGGGQLPMPGEVSLAHHGILLLDELPECTRHVLEVLRQAHWPRCHLRHLALDRSVGEDHRAAESKTFACLIIVGCGKARRP